MNSILTVTTAASSYDLTTLATVKTELGITDSSQNDKLSTWITQASKIAASYCKRVFAQETLSEAFRPPLRRPYGAGYDVLSNRRESLLLTRAPVASITSVTVDDTALTSSQYEVDSSSGLLYRLDDSGYRSYWSFYKSVVVVYVAGYELLATLPQEIERAVIMIVRDFYFEASRDPELIEQDIPGVIRQRWWMSGDAKTPLSIEITGLLDPYANHWVG